MSMFCKSGKMTLSERTVGVIERVDGKTHPGYNLVCIGCNQFLIDFDGRVVHEWQSERACFCAYLLPNGHLLRDGSDSLFASSFRTGGAAGYVEEVTWDNERVWCFSHPNMSLNLTHHDLEYLPNGNFLILSWERKTKEEALKAGRRAELLPEGEVWDNLIVELKPNGHGGADIVWKWSLWDHLIQDTLPDGPNYCTDFASRPERFDVNYCTPGGKQGARDLRFLQPGQPQSAAQSVINGNGLTGEKDWLHVNSLCYDPIRKQLLISLNVPAEFIIINHTTTMEESSGEAGNILYRWGNPQTYRQGNRSDQVAFCQHSVKFIRNGVYNHSSNKGKDMPGEGHILFFNNGRRPDRAWSSVDEIVLPETSLNSGVYIKEAHRSFGPDKLHWTYGPKVGRKDFFYCTHISSCQRLTNGNTLITQGTLGIISEVTLEGTEVWRYNSPVVSTGEDEGTVSFVKQGSTRFQEAGRRSLFRVTRYDLDYDAFEGREIVPGRYLEA